VAWGREALKRALERATTYRRFTAADVRAILAAGLGVAEPTRAGQPLSLDLPAVAERPLSAYALTQLVLPSISTTEHAVDGGRGLVGGRA
jgi:plasmid stability protein